MGNQYAWPGLTQVQMANSNSASSSLALLAVRSAPHHRHDVRSREFRPLRCGQLARSSTWTGLCVHPFTAHGPRFLHELE